MLLSNMGAPRCFLIRPNRLQRHDPARRVLPVNSFTFCIYKNPQKPPLQPLWNLHLQMPPSPTPLSSAFTKTPGVCPPCDPKLQRSNLQRASRVPARARFATEPSNQKAFNAKRCKNCAQRCSCLPPPSVVSVQTKVDYGNSPMEVDTGFDWNTSTRGLCLRRRKHRDTSVSSIFRNVQQSWIVFG